MKQGKSAKNQRQFSKIDQIVPYDDELDYIRDCDGDYGLDEVRFRFEFEMSPDGRHIVRPISEVNPREIDSTHELLIRETKLLGKAFNYTDEQIQKLFKELFRVTYAWYVSTGYPLEHLRKLVTTGYFKHPEDIMDFIFVIDDFTYADEIFAQIHEPFSENGIRNFTASTDEEMIEELDEEADETENLICPESVEIFQYNFEKEYDILERLSEIKKKLEAETDPDKKDELEEERRALTAKIRKMREEFLIEHEITYEDFLLMRRESYTGKNWGWIKYPIYGEEEEYDKWEFIENILRGKLYEIEINLSLADPEDKEKIKELREKKERFARSLERIRFKRMSSEEKKIYKVHKLIDKIYRLGKDKNRLAYKLTETAKVKINQIRSHAVRRALFSLLNEVWKKRKERFEILFEKYKKAQLVLPFVRQTLQL